MTLPVTAAPQRHGPRVGVVVEQLWQPVPGGSGTYIRELVAALRADGARLAGLAAHHRGTSPQEVGLPEDLPLRCTHLPRRALYDAWNTLRRPLAEAVLPGAEVIHATTWALPGTRLPLAVTVHDVAFLRTPEHFTRRGNRYFHRSLERTIREAGAVIVPSQATADDCVRAGIDANRIVVVPHGVRTLPVTDQDMTEFRSAHNLHRPYLLWTGTREPRKNLPTLLAAFEIVAQTNAELDLVLVGPQGWGQDAAEQRMTEDLADRVHVLGRLRDADLAAAYRGAQTFAFPSHWEGFGLPVLEAMAYGTPVVTSRGTCMEEVVGDAGLLADPNDAQELAAQIAKAAGEAHDTLAAAGLAQATGFTWERSARAHAQIYAALAEKGTL